MEISHSGEAKAKELLRNFKCFKAIDKTKLIYLHEYSPSIFCKICYDRYIVNPFGLINAQYNLHILVHPFYKFSEFCQICNQLLLKIRTADNCKHCISLANEFGQSISNEHSFLME